MAEWRILTLVETAQGERWGRQRAIDDAWRVARVAVHRVTPDSATWPELVRDVCNDGVRAVIVESGTLSFQAMGVRAEAELDAWPDAEFVQRTKQRNQQAARGIGRKTRLRDNAIRKHANDYRKRHPHGSAHSTSVLAKRVAARLRETPTWSTVTPEAVRARLRVLKIR